MLPVWIKSERYEIPLTFILSSKKTYWLSGSTRLRLCRSFAAERNNVLKKGVKGIVIPMLGRPEMKNLLNYDKKSVWQSKHTWNCPAHLNAAQLTSGRGLWCPKLSLGCCELSPLCSSSRCNEPSGGLNRMSTHFSSSGSWRSHRVKRSAACRGTPRFENPCRGCNLHAKLIARVRGEEAFDCGYSESVLGCPGLTTDHTQTHTHTHTHPTPVHMPLYYWCSSYPSIHRWSGPYIIKLFNET